MGDIPYHEHLNLNGKQIKKGGFESLPSAPSSPSIGQTYFNSLNGRNYSWNGTSWKCDAETLGGQDSSYHRTVNNFIKPSHTASSTPDVLKSMFDVLRADRTAFLPEDQIIIEQSIDGGITWTDAGVSASNKRKLFTGQRPSLSIPFKNGLKSCDCMLRVTITGMKYNQSAATGETARYNYWNNNYVQSTERYCTLSDSWVWLTSNMDKIYCKIERAAGNTPNTWLLDGEGYLNGWSGGNYLKLSNDVFGGGTTQISNKWNRRITFRTCSNSNTFIDADLTQSHLTYIQSIHHIKMTGLDSWSSPNNLAYHDHLYSWDEYKNVYFPAAVQSNETINYDLSEEPAETGSKTKTSTTLWQNIFKHINFLWLKLKDLFPSTQSATHNYLPKIDNSLKKLVKSNIYDDGTTLKYGANTIWHSGNDGSSSGLDADLLDGKHASDFENSSISLSSGTDLNTLTSGKYHTTSSAIIASLLNCPVNSGELNLIVYNSGSNSYVFQELYFITQKTVYQRTNNGGTWSAWQKVWNSSNDGSGSGLDADLLDGIDSSGFATAAQGTKANSAIQGVKNGTNSLVPDGSKIVTLPLMVGASQSVAGYQGLVPTPAAGQQNLFLKGDGTFTSPTSDIITVATYVIGTSTGATFTQNASNTNVVLTSNYVSYIANPAIPNIVEVFYNGSKLLVNTDFTINTSGGNTITILNYTLVNTDVIVINYKTAIGSYGSVFQNAVDNCITATSNADLATINANNAALYANTEGNYAKSIADSKIDKTAIVDKLGTDPNKIMSQKATTDAIMKSYNYDVNQLAYGVRLDMTSDGKTLVRVGNLSLHKTRPITGKTKNCVKNIAGVNYYLSDDTDLLKADGVTPSVLDGTDGDVMKEIPEFYVREYTEGNYAYTYISEFPLPNFIRIPKTYHGLYEGSYNTTTNQLRSVINATIKTGLPATGQSRSYYNNGARLNRNITWNIDTLLSNYVRELLFRVDYATYDSQAPYNSQPTAEGYLQGGLGAGVTTLGSRWEWNGYNPFIPCGYTSNLGNKTGVKDFTMPYGYDAQNATTHVNWYKGIYNTATIYNVGEYVADNDDTTIGQGDGKLYKCIQQTTAGIPLTNTAYFTEQIRTKVQVNRFLVEIPFGHTFKHTIDSIIELTNGYTTTKCYIYDNPEHYPTSNANDIKTANARFLCNMPSAEGYVKTFNKYTLVPYAIGGSSNSWGYDYYYWRGETGGVLRGLLFGGYAKHGANAGFGFSNAYFSPTCADAYFGVRLCCFEENIVINS